ncbi:hypothetical protein [Caballeronia zhejiangensis]|uniref:hypothetical protein n=1 Tax=Caballeronia zhejiangensis TaxID=871203 RepID=UPI00158BA1ED|nr:hypothetical protein [Caballeronia zhejiangensis]
MSTKSTIKWREQTETAPGFHLYDDVFDAEDDPPVYLQIDGINASVSIIGDSASVTLALPRELARALGIIKGEPPQ